MRPSLLTLSLSWFPSRLLAGQNERNSAVTQAKMGRRRGRDAEVVSSRKGEAEEYFTVVPAANKEPEGEKEKPW